MYGKNHIRYYPTTACWSERNVPRMKVCWYYVNKVCKEMKKDKWQCKRIKTFLFLFFVLTSKKIWVRYSVGTYTYRRLMMRSILVCGYSRCLQPTIMIIACESLSLVRPSTVSSFISTQVLCISPYSRHFILFFNPTFYTLEFGASSFIVSLRYYSRCPQRSVISSAYPPSCLSLCTVRHSQYRKSTGSKISKSTQKSEEYQSVK